MSDPPKSPTARRRFAPVPIETTFEQYRRSGPPAAPAAPAAATGPRPPAATGPRPPAARHGPTAELTPSPSPRSGSPVAGLWSRERMGLPPKQPPPPPAKRQFKPQLIESSRRSRRLGDIGPATKPTDKTDITPHHHHIYAPKSRKKHHTGGTGGSRLNAHKQTQSLARRESCDEETAAHVFEMLAREAEKRMIEEAALAAFPNSGARAGGAEHFVIREGSEDDSSGVPSRDFSVAQLDGMPTRRARRSSSTEDVGWAFKEMQEHVAQLLKEREREREHPHLPFSGRASPFRTLRSGPVSAIGTPVIPEALEETELAEVSEMSLGGHAAGVSGTDKWQLPQANRISTVELDQMSIDSPPSDPIWTTTPGNRDGSIEMDRTDTVSDIGDAMQPPSKMGTQMETQTETQLEPQLERVATSDGGFQVPPYARKLREAEGEADDDEEQLMREMRMAAAPIVERLKASIASAKKAAEEAKKAAEAKAAAEPQRTPSAGHRSDSKSAKRRFAPEPIETTSLRGRNILSKPVYRGAGPPPAVKDPNWVRRVPAPMLGKDLTFRTCETPQQTKMEPEFLWGINHVVEKSHHLHPAFAIRKTAEPAQLVKDVGGDDGHGLWHGTCFTSDRTQAVVPIQRTTLTTLIATPFVTSPADPFSEAFGEHSDADDADDADADADADANADDDDDDDRMEFEKERKSAQDELEEKINREFTDQFVTDVYNYLSLGYPALACDYDDELSRISHVAVADLEAEDRAPHGARGNIVGAGDADKKNCPRWQALKSYIHEWARQHPDLDNMAPRDWGMQERRGSWGL